jgi:hypothetical protein
VTPLTSGDLAEPSSRVVLEEELTNRIPIKIKRRSSCGDRCHPWFGFSAGRYLAAEWHPIWAHLVNVQHYPVVGICGVVAEGALHLLTASLLEQRLRTSWSLDRRIWSRI